MRKVEVTSYNKEWPALFQQEAEKLYQLFGTEIVDIYHIGSTAVPGLKAKPIIDMIPVVQNINRVDSFDNEMRELGYEGKGENGISGRRFFQKGGDQRTHHIHMFELGNSHIKRHLAFRDYLRIHSSIANEYGNIKDELARTFTCDVESYIKGKHALVSKIEQQALDWYEKK